MLAARELWTLGPAASERQAKRNINRAIDTVSERLGNTRAVCRKYYIHPLLLDAYLKGRTGVLNGNGHEDGANGGDAIGNGNGEAPRQRGKAALRREEVAVLQFLQEQ
jgi:DNA topoisomerase-1